MFALLVDDRIYSIKRDGQRIRARQLEEARRYVPSSGHKVIISPFAYHESYDTVAENLY